ncbi:MAG: hypothetical protein IT302_05875 [Dehalococcoidia bacterium]|nr:hypothetical protein [Dehalococcoidia bacterium]
MKLRIAPRLVFFAAALTGAAVTFAACGDDGAEPTPTAASTATAPAPTAVASTTVTRTPSAVPATATIGATVSPGATTPVEMPARVPSGFTGAALLRDVRIGVHPEESGWDRIVFEFAGALPAARVEYVTSATACGSGQPVSLPGTATLAVTFRAAAAHNDAGQATFAQQTIAGPGKTILQARQTCDFEAVLAWAAGIAGRQNFKVFQLENPYRLVVDVQFTPGPSR